MVLYKFCTTGCRSGGRTSKVLNAFANTIVPNPANSNHLNEQSELHFVINYSKNSHPEIIAHFSC